MSSQVADIPEGYEPAEVSHAKNHAHDAIEKALEGCGVDPYPETGGLDLIHLADAVVEGLLEAGVQIPEGISNPHRISH